MHLPSVHCGLGAPCAVQVILTPHIGWQRFEARQRVVDTCAENIAAFARGEPMNIDMETGLPRVVS